MAYDSRDPVWTLLVDITDDKRDALRERIAAVEPDYAIRGAFLNLIRPALARQRPEALETWDRFARERPRLSMFSMAPTREMMLQLAYAGQLFHPDKTLDEGANALAATGSDLIWDIHVMRPIVNACENDVQRLLELYAASARLLYNRGSMLYERRGASEAALYLEDIPSSALSMVILGFWRAIMARFAEAPRIDYYVYTPARSELHLRW